MKPFDIKKTTNIGRNGFDLSQRHLFNAACGQLLPIVCEETYPGDSFRLQLDSFTRLRPMFTPAFARFKEYFDVFWISRDDLWPYFNSLVVNNNEPYPMPSGGSTVPSRLPNVSVVDLASAIDTAAQPIPQYDDMGMAFRAGADTLFDMFRFGQYSDYVRVGQPSNTNDIRVNLLKPAMYQRIYADFYRNPQWERRDVDSYNLAKYYGSSVDIESASDVADAGLMFKMRYANWHKDYFMGLYPTQQFGDVSVISSGPATPTRKPSSAAGVYVNSTGTLYATGANPLDIMSDFSIIDLRRAQAVQRWKEVTMTNGSSMYQQVKAHFGFELPEGRKGAPQFLGSWDNVVTIQDVTSTSPDISEGSQSRLGDLAGKGSAASDPSKVISFDSKDFGMFMVIYHCEPYLDYANVGVKKDNLKLEAGDFFQPEFDRIGFGRVNLYELMYFPENVDNSLTLGYGSQYLDLKTSFDIVHGSYTLDSGDSAAWSIKLKRSYWENYFRAAAATGIDYRFFKIPSSITNDIFRLQIDSSNVENRAPFQVCPNFRILKSSNMSVDSLPM